VKIHRKYKNSKSQIRHTHRTAAALEDAMSVALDIIREVELSQQVVMLRSQALMSILRETRAGPHAYNLDRPAGSRIIVKKR
jgi:hypothetical protein